MITYKFKIALDHVTLLDKFLIEELPIPATEKLQIEDEFSY